MSWWNNILGGRSAEASGKPDYYQEGMALLRQEKFHEALTSFRLALREEPDDMIALQQIAVTYTRIGMTDEAVKTYRRVLDMKADAPGAHYGLAFLLLQRGEREDAADHLRIFLAEPPPFPDAERHIAHARETLAEITGEAEVVMDTPPEHS